MVKSGSQVLTEFLASLAENTEVHPAVLAAVVDLHKSSKLTKTRLLTQLERLREADQASTAGEADHD